MELATLPCLCLFYRLVLPVCIAYTPPPGRGERGRGGERREERGERREERGERRLSVSV